MQVLIKKGRGDVLRLEFYPETKLLLVDKSDEKVIMRYEEDTWEMPKTGERPPYYMNPKLEAAYPVI